MIYFDILLSILLLLIAVEHFYFLILEMFFWTSPKVMKIFKIQKKEIAEDSKTLAANLGLYNGFLAIGILIATFRFMMSGKYDSYGTIIFLLICVTCAGIYGAWSTKNKRIFYVQAMPALLALIVMHVPILIFF